jgi:protein-S-isoprenylcysteine O-methyltransferase Ste14
MTQVIAFIVLSIGILYISRASLRSPGSHGFYRFFVFECILALALLNLTLWFRDPWSWNQWISWFLLFACCIPLVFGVRQLIAQGRPVEQRLTQPELLAFEKTSQLVTTGIYRYIRHPMYSSLLLLVWGMVFKSLTVPSVALGMVASVFLLATAQADEAECIRFFGPAYQDYMKTTHRFIPFVI